MALDRKIMKNWLIGATSDAENEHVGVRMIEDDAFAADMSLAESELIEEYLEGGLTEAERELFELNYLVNDERRELVNEVALLKKYSGGSNKVSEPLPIRTWLDTVFGWRPNPLVFGPVVILILVLLGWQFLLNSDSNELETRYAEINREDVSDLSRFSQMELYPGTFRNGGNGGPVFKIGSSGESVVFRMPLTFTPSEGTQYGAVLTINGKQVFNVEKIQTLVVGSSQEARVVLPRSVFEKGQCQIILTPKIGGHSPIIYTFMAE